MSLLWAGGGQVYNGEPRKAVLFLAAWLAIAAVLVVLSNVAAPTPALFAIVLLLVVINFGIFIWAVVDAFRQARRVPMLALKRYQRVWCYLLFFALWVAVVEGAGALMGWRSFTTASASMMPTVPPGDYFLAQRYGRNQMPQRGDLVIFHHPRDRQLDYFKRLVGLPGDRVELRRGDLYVNGVMLERQHVGTWQSAAGGPAEIYVETTLDGRHYRIAKSELERVVDNVPEIVIPAGRYYVLGDNRDNSIDSRDPNTGFIGQDDIIGRAYTVWWSSSPSRIGTQLE
jgi:signal peptidase I